jgi:hypothetical protein
MGLASRSRVLSMTLRTYASPKSGSMPLEHPAIMLMVPVGAMDSTVALRIFIPSARS